MNRLRSVLAAAVLIAMLVALTSCGGASNPYGTGTSGAPGNATGGGASTGNTITMQNLAFSPTSLTVKAGDTVTFKNADTAPHHIVVGTNDLGVQQPGESKTWTAPKDATYVMKCLIHPSMQGQITVGAGGATVGTPSSGGGTGGGGATGNGTSNGYGY
jgi:plastocyanin